MPGQHHLLLCTAAAAVLFLDIISFYIYQCRNYPVYRAALENIADTPLTDRRFSVLHAWDLG